MTQKELNYLEDIYNHEILLLNNLKYFNKEVDECYNFNNLIKNHETFIEKLNNLMEDNL